MAAFSWSSQICCSYLFNSCKYQSILLLYILWVNSWIWWKVVHYFKKEDTQFPSEHANVIVTVCSNVQLQIVSLTNSRSQAHWQIIKQSVWDSLDIVRHFPRLPLPSVPNLLEGPEKGARPADGVSEMFENPLPHNSSVMKCLKKCGLERRRAGVRLLQSLWQILCSFPMSHTTLQHFD